MKFKQLTAALCGLLVTLTAGGAGKKISDYTETLTVLDAWIYEIAVPGVTNYKVTFGTLATNIIARVPVGGGGDASQTDLTNKIGNLNGFGTNATFYTALNLAASALPTTSNSVDVGSHLLPVRTNWVNDVVAKETITVHATTNDRMFQAITSTGTLAYVRAHIPGDGLFPSFPTNGGVAGAIVVANTHNSNYLALTEYEYGMSIQWRNDDWNGLEFHCTQANGSGGAVCTMIGDDTQNILALRNTSDTGDINLRWVQAWGVFDINTTGPLTDILIDPNSGKLRIQAFLLPEVDASYDLGTNSLKWRDLWVSRKIVLGATSATSKLDVKADGNTSATYSLGVRNASDVYYLVGRDDGRVGVGTITPGAVLDVAQVPGTIGPPIFHAGTNAANGITVSSNGNVGILTATPSSPLTVTGDAEISGVLYNPTIRVTTLSDYLGASANASIAFAGAFKYINFATDGAERMRVDITGAVGIGTPAPSSTLDVTGGVRAASAIFTNSLVVNGVTITGSGGGGTNFPPIITTGTNITVGTGVRKSLVMSSNVSAGISFNGTEILGETVTLVVTNTSAAASNITINFFQDGVASSYFDAMVASNVTGFLVVTNSSKRLEFVYNGTFWRLESTLAKEMELSIAGGLSLHTNTVTSIVTLSNSLAIQQLNNVGVGTPANGDILSWNSAMGRWTNGVVPGGDVISNITVSATNNVLLDFGAANIFKLTLLTNWTETFTNVTLLTKKGYVYYQQDTNGARLLNNYYVSGGLLQTNATENMQPTTNANALDLLEIMPGFFTTNLIAYWPQDFQPRIKFTNSLHAFASFLDTFNRSNADPMSTTASDGNTWTSGPGALGEPRIVSAMLFGNTGATGCRVLTPTLVGNQRASLTLLNDVGHIGPMVRIQSASVASGYMLVADDSTHLAIYKITDTGTLDNDILFTSTATPTMQAGDTITLSVNGTTLEAFLNGVSYGSVVDATFSGGQPGIWSDSDIASGGPFTASEQ